MGCWLSQRWSAAEKVAGDIERSRDLLRCGGGVEPDVARGCKQCEVDCLRIDVFFVVAHELDQRVVVVAGEFRCAIA